jgi:hypothetical protein
MDLLSEIKRLVAEERRITKELLKLLARAERERLYARRGYSSLFEFCVKELGYSEGAASRRVGAMRLMQAHAGLEQKLRSGDISVTVASRLESAFRKSSISDETKAQIVRAAEGLTVNELERKVAQILPEVKIPQKELRLCRSGIRLLSLELDESVIRMLDGLKEKYSHRKPGMTYGDLIEILARDALKPVTHRNPASGEAVRYISPALKTKIRERDGGRCTYEDPLTRRRCDARYFLEFDHIIPVSRGGRATLSNLRLLCRIHNRLAAEDAGVTF